MKKKNHKGILHVFTQNKNDRYVSSPMNNYYMVNKITELSISNLNIFIIKQQSIMPNSIKKVERNNQVNLKLFNILT